MPSPALKHREPPLAKIGPIEAFSDIVGCIYDCALDPQRWPEVLTALCREMDFRMLSLILAAQPGRADAEVERRLQAGQLAVDPQVHPPVEPGGYVESLSVVDGAVGLARADAQPVAAVAQRAQRELEQPQPRGRRRARSRRRRLAGQAAGQGYRRGGARHRAGACPARRAPQAPGRA